MTRQRESSEIKNGKRKKINKISDKTGGKIRKI